MRLFPSFGGTGDVAGGWSGLGTTLLVQDGFMEDVGRVFRDGGDPVQFCAEYESQSVKEGGDVIISGVIR